MNERGRLVISRTAALLLLLLLAASCASAPETDSPYLVEGDFRTRIQTQEDQGING